MVQQPLTGITAAVSSNVPVCLGDSLGMTGITTGGSGNTYIQWATPSGTLFFQPKLSIKNVQPFTAGSYVFTATDDSGCVVTDTVYAALRDAPRVDSIGYIAIAPGVDSFFCYNAHDVDSYYWKADNGATYNTAEAVHRHTDENGYGMKLIVRGMCGADTLYKNIPSTVSVHISHTYAGVKVYPNPFTDMLMVRIADVKEFSVQVYSVQGKGIGKMQRTINGNMQLDLGVLPPGVYYLQISSLNAENIQILKLVK